MSASPHPKRLINASANIPSSGWSARQPETGAVLRGLSIKDTMRNVQKYRAANKLPMDINFRRQVEIQICDTLSDENAGIYCTFLEDDDSRNPPSLRRFRSTSTDLENFGKAVQSVLETASKDTPLHVSQEEANKRAAICASCSYNLPIANCWGCGVLGSIYRGIVGYKATASDTQLRSCDVCGCDNKTQVHFTKEVLQLAASKQELVSDEFPNWCWKKDALQAKDYHKK